MTTGNPVQKRKLIEVALPLEAINREAQKDGPKRKNHPWRMHYWWSRKPLAIARAVLFAQLVDDPSSRPGEFPSDEQQRQERERLHKLIERLVAWENIQNEELLAEAKREILKSSNGNAPPILDPFAGSGSIPLEAQRLGLKSHASDLNPVAVLIDKALIEIPPKFAGRPPVSQAAGSNQLDHAWPRATGLAEDVRQYGRWIRDEAKTRIGHLYPEATLPDGSKAAASAWIWARTITCPNPACGIAMPLTSKWWLSKKGGKEVYVVPSVKDGKIHISIGHDPDGAPTEDSAGTVSGRTGANCIGCGAHVPADEVHAQLDVTSPPQPLLLATICTKSRTRTYAAPDQGHLDAVLNAAEPASAIRSDAGSLAAETRGTFASNAQGRRYGFFMFADYFTDRQLVALSTFSSLVVEARELVLTDALSTGMIEGDRLEDGGTDAAAYADAVATYLGLAVSRGSDYQSNLTTWHYRNEQVRNVFARQGISMAWDFLEVNPFGDGSGTWQSQYELGAQALDGLPASATGYSVQQSAQDIKTPGVLISTDPPYYDNVCYSDLSDFYYVWLRQSLKLVYPRLLATMTVPKAEELVANQYRHGGRDNAKKFFERGFYDVFATFRQVALDDYPIVIYYAFKQSESDALGEVSSGWETLLDGMVSAGWEITSTWPFRTETASRILAIGTNALASSIVLSLRPRPEGAPTTDRRGFISALEQELPAALRKLQQGLIAPVDLPQAAVGPGMSVFSRYRSVLESDGLKMTVRSALARINAVLDQVLNEQEGDFDATSRFAIAWYRQHSYSKGKFGDADNLARARNTGVDTMDRDGILTSRAGNVALIRPSHLDAKYDVSADQRTSNWEALHHLIRILEQQGIWAAGEFLRTALSREDGAIEADLVKELAHLLFRIAESNGWTKDALSFNNLVTSWPEIVESAEDPTAQAALQSSFDYDEEADS